MTRRIALAVGAVLVAVLVGLLGFAAAYDGRQADAVAAARYSAGEAYLSAGSWSGPSRAACRPSAGGTS